MKLRAERNSVDAMLGFKASPAVEGIVLTRVASYTNAIEAHLARLRLAEEGIPAFVFNEHHVWLQWDMSQALGGVAVHVPAEYLMQAKAAITAHDAGAFALAEPEPTPRCPRCGETDIARKRVSWKAAMLAAHLAPFPLYFRPATLRCAHCGYGWDLPLTRRYSLAAIGLSALIAAALIAAPVVIAMCQAHDYPSIFPPTNGCR